ncbi:TIR domain-containing protein [Streptomyces sp. H39-S7]|uniref:TIR domain-containing protein n=1 Tax=Streptomyces sp. H39-S7 TaxID=3004357 RepID=UPI0022AF4093|nr:TIR domain-containing protein [Streptomyces sp. H39-S7]MCZ4125294.1 TIR domain-containing protein [Streptomyces sp. H39-S7]
MRQFVSYARRDNGTERLVKIKEFLCRRNTGSVYIDDLEIHDPLTGRVASVVAAIEAANVLIAIPSENYLQTKWTRWEFETAISRNVPIMALLPNWDLVLPNNPGWPWPPREETRGYIGDVGAPAGKFDGALPTYP